MADGWKWHAIWNEHAGRLRRAVRARLGDAHGSEEVLQETALAAAKLTAPPKEPSAWLYRVALRLASLRRRKLGRERRLTERFAAEPPPTAPVDPLAWLLAGERRQRVRQALGRLPESVREILLLKYAENRSSRTIAQHLGLSVEAVDVRLHRARAALRRELQNMGEDDGN
jgi:RNA polymerase sigma-70 factor (ECF subfamily)